MSEVMKYGRGEYGTFVLTSKNVYDHGNPQDMVMKTAFDATENAKIAVPFPIGTKLTCLSGEAIAPLTVEAVGETDDTPCVIVPGPCILFGTWGQM